MSKIRIILYENQTEVNGDFFTIAEDRLVEAGLEFRVGPKEKHEGPIRIDYMMGNQDEVNGLIQYLQQIVGNLPIVPKEARGRKSTQTNKPLEADSLKTLIKEAFHKCKTQEALIDYLRGLNFAFVTQEHLTDIAQANGWKFKLKRKVLETQTGDNGGKEVTKSKTLHKDYQFMLRVLKLAKNPAKDKYDPQIFFGFKLIGDKLPKVQIYLSGKFAETRELHWAEGEEVQFKVKEKFYKFPEPMTYEERAKWRAEDRKVIFNEGYEPSPFYLRWKEYVTILKPQRPKKRRK